MYKVDRQFKLISVSSCLYHKCLNMSHSFTIECCTYSSLDYTLILFVLEFSYKVFFYCSDILFFGLHTSICIIPKRKQYAWLILFFLL